MVLVKQSLDRIRDEQRGERFEAFAAQVSYDGDLTHFGIIHDRAKQLRDMLGHSHNVIGLVHSTGGPRTAGRSEVESDLQRINLVVAAGLRRVPDLAWFVRYMADEVDSGFRGHGHATRSCRSLRST